jgi:hypothetical protein
VPPTRTTAKASTQWVHGGRWNWSMAPVHGPKVTVSRRVELGFSCMVGIERVCCHAPKPSALGCSVVCHDAPGGASDVVVMRAQSGVCARDSAPALLPSRSSPGYAEMRRHKIISESGKFGKC